MDVCMNGLWLMDIFSYFLSQIFSWYLGLFVIANPIYFVCIYPANAVSNQSSEN